MRLEVGLFPFEGHPEDGSAVLFRPPGALLAPDVLLSAVRSGKAPEHVPEAQRAAVELQLAYTAEAWKAKPKVHRYCEIKWGREAHKDPRRFRIAIEEIERIRARGEELLELGWDTSWGMQERSRFGVLICELDEHQVRRLQEPIGEGEGLCHRFRIPYERLPQLSPTTVRRWLDHGITHAVRRDVEPLTFEQLLVEEREKSPDREGRRGLVRG